MARRRMGYAIGPVLAGLALIAVACGSDGDTAESGPEDAGPSSTPASPTLSTPSTPTESTPTNSTPSSPPTSDPPTGDPSVPSDPPTEEPMPNTGPVAEAIADLADSSGVSPDDIQVVVHEQVTWRDGSLGCPEPGMMYTQALVDGYRIVLRAEGQTVHYHGSAGGSPSRCDHPDPNGAVGQRS